MAARASSGLVAELERRRDAALVEADMMAGSSLGLAESLGFESRLDDLARYNSLLGSVQVTRDEPVYRLGGPFSFWADLEETGGPGQERIARHQRQERERRDIGTSAMTGLMVPQYLVELAEPVARAARPLVDRIGPLPLPDEGQQVIIGQATAGAAGVKPRTRLPLLSMVLWVRFRCRCEQCLRGRLSHGN